MILFQSETRCSWVRWLTLIFGNVILSLYVSSYFLDSNVRISRQRIAELEVKLQHVDSIWRSKEAELLHVYSQIYSQPEIKQIANQSVLINPLVKVGFPSYVQFLPHLLDNPDSLRPRYLFSKGRTGVSFVLGVPTVKRERETYFIKTLEKLLDGMSVKESRDVVIIVLVAEVDLEYVLQIKTEIEIRFKPALDSGLIEIVAPNPGYYPDFNKLPITHEDSRARVRWRSKLTLDCAYLMAYAQPKGAFYVHLEDDVLVKKGYVADMHKFVSENYHEKWFILDFSKKLGCIGKMFKSVDLPWVIQFLQMFYNDQPLDWLFRYLTQSMFCDPDMSQDFCERDVGRYWIPYKRELFLHIGRYSSLDGQVYHVLRASFESLQLFTPRTNPPATVITDIQEYKKYTLQNCYEGKVFFWGVRPEAGETVVIFFSHSIIVERFFFASGNVAFPFDVFHNTTVEVLPDLKRSNSSLRRYVTVGEFVNGNATGTLNKNFGRIRGLRLHVKVDHKNWALLSEIHIIEGSPDESRFPAPVQ